MISPDFKFENFTYYDTEGLRNLLAIATDMVSHAWAEAAHPAEVECHLYSPSKTRDENGQLNLVRAVFTESRRSRPHEVGYAQPIPLHCRIGIVKKTALHESALAALGAVEHPVLPREVLIEVLVLYVSQHPKGYHIAEALWDRYGIEGESPWDGEAKRKCLEAAAADWIGKGVSVPVRKKPPPGAMKRSKFLFASRRYEKSKVELEWAVFTKFKAQEDLVDSVEKEAAARIRYEKHKTQMEALGGKDID